MIITNEVFSTICITNRDATIAHVDFDIDEGSFEAEGTSKRDPIDDHDPEVAVLLAYGRAFEALGKKMQKRAQSLTKHADDVRAYKEKQKTKTPAPAKAATKKPSIAAARKAKVAARK